MMSSSCKTNLVNGWSENPLDLSVKRSKMDSHFNSRNLPSPWPNHTDIVVTRQQNVYDILTGTINSCAPPTVECSTNHCSYYPSVQSLHSDYYDSNVPYRETEMNSNMNINQLSDHISHPDPSSHMHHQPLSSRVLPGECLSYNRCLLPKKRKHLWQPYDGKVAIGVSAELYKNGDSSSDSVTSLSSDIEYKNANVSETVLKKCKCHWQSEDIIAASVTQGNVIQSNHSLDTVNTDTLTGGNEGIKSGFTSVLAHVHFPDTSEKLISKMNKSDIFEWTLKPVQPDLATNITVDDNNDNDDDDEYINQDGDKKYFELQSFKENNASDLVIGSTILENHLKLEIDREVCPNDQMLLLQSVKLNDRNMSDSDGRVKFKEADVINVDSKRIYIRRYDNVTESFGEAQNKMQSKDTKKGLSINDLLEDIETESLKNGKNAEIDSSDRTKRNVIKLLQQCNHVKLQALDYLMSNVLIDDLPKASTNRNQTIQKILNGDKIKTVNMLDIVELQVEIGLR